MQFESVPKFKQFAEFLEGEIREGKFKPGTKLLSERDLGRKYELSHMTVNKALSGLVEKKLLKRAYGDGTYVADLKENLISHRTVGLVIDTEERSHPPFTKYLPSQLQSKGYFSTLMDISNNIKPHLERFLEEESFGLIADGYSVFPFDTLSKLKKSARLVFIHRFEGPRKYKASYVLSDYVKGGYLATKHLLKAGRKNILILSFEMRPGWTSDLFYRGCLKAQKEYGGEFTSLDATKEIPGKTYHELFKSPQRPDGIVSLSDPWIIPTLKILQDLGLKVPDDVALIGYHNTPWAEGYNLTSVSINKRLISRKAIEMLEIDKNEEIYVEPEFVFRDSCPENF